MKYYATRDPNKKNQETMELHPLKPSMKLTSIHLDVLIVSIC